VPLDQAAWAYASDKLLRSLKQYEKDGGATTDALLHGSTVTILPDTQALAIAKSQWPQLLRQAVAELEEKIQAGTLESVNGLIRPVGPCSERRKSSQEPAAEPASEREVGGRSSEITGQDRVLLRQFSDEKLAEELFSYQKRITEEAKLEGNVRYLCSKDELEAHAKKLRPSITPWHFRQIIMPLFRSKAPKTKKGEEAVITSPGQAHKTRPWPLNS
jgi:hypothetical protein